MNVLEIYRALKNFLNDNKFSNTDLVAKFENNKKNFTIQSEQLTEEGMNWVKSNLDKWFRNIDRRKKH